MKAKKVIEGPQTLIILLVLAAIALYSAYNYQLHVQELQLMEERVQETQTNQELMIRIMEMDLDDDQMEELREDIEEDINLEDAIEEAEEEEEEDDDE